MDAGPVVDTYVVVLCLRLMDMHTMCDSLAKICDEKKRDKTARRLRRAAVGFREILEEVTNECKQTSLL